MMRNAEQMVDPTANDAHGFWELVHFKSKGDHRGDLVAIEAFADVPFEIRRVYYLIKTREKVRRGFHAHLQLDQVLVAVSGACKVLVDDGDRREEFVLDDCQKGLRLKNLVWREMYEFSSDCVLLVIASEYYSEDDYIRNYEEFLDVVRSRK